MRYNIFDTTTNSATFLTKENPYLFSRKPFPKDGILILVGGKSPSYFLDKKNAKEAIVRTLQFFRSIKSLTKYKFIIKESKEEKPNVISIDKDALELAINKQVKFNRKSLVVEFSASKIIVDKGVFKGYSIGLLATMLADKTGRKVKILNPVKLNEDQVKIKNYNKFNH